MIRTHWVLAVASVLANAWSVADEPPMPPTHRDVSHGPHVRNVVDFWQAPQVGPRPLLIYIHGGGWVAGDKKHAPDRFRPFLERGISCAAINYRLTGEAPLPAPVHDAARAIPFLRSRASRWRIAI